MVVILPAHRLNVVRYPRIVGPEFAAALVTGVAEGRYPSDYDILMDLSGAERIEITIDEMISLAMARRATLPAEPEACIRNAVLGAKEAVWSTLETWNAFFHEARRPVELHRTETLEAALAWLGRPGALNDVSAALSAQRRT